MKEAWEVIAIVYFYLPTIIAKQVHPFMRMYHETNYEPSLEHTTSTMVKQESQRRCPIDVYQAPIKKLMSHG